MVPLLTDSFRRALRPGVIAAALAAPAFASPNDEPDRVAIDELARAYLWCSRAATDGTLGSGAIMRCSVVYEALKRRAFGGDFAALLAWSRAQPLPAATPPSR